MSQRSLQWGLVFKMLWGLQGYHTLEKATQALSRRRNLDERGYKIYLHYALYHQTTTTMTLRVH